MNDAKYFEPLSLHELCKCEECHKADLHEEIEAWSDICPLCASSFQKAVETGEYCLVHARWYCEEGEKHLHNDKKAA